MTERSGRDALVWKIVCGTLLPALLALLLSASSARADLTFGTFGDGAGETNSPSDIALDAAADRLYVADRDNNRVDVFDTGGDFLMAFGWGVADGESAEPQVCTVTCHRGLAGGGAGQFKSLSGIAVDPDSHRVYTYDGNFGEGNRVQAFEPSGEFLRAWGGGVVAGASTGSASFSAGSKTLTNVITTLGAFEPGATLLGTGLAAGTKVVAVGPGTITLSKPATGSGTRAISVAAGSGNVPVNELQEITIPASGSEFGLAFTVDSPESSLGETPRDILESGATALEVREGIESLANVSPGDVEVTGPVGGPYLIEMKGRFADTDVNPIDPRGSGGLVLSRTVRNGGSSPEVCAAPTASSCAGGALGVLPGTFFRVGEITTTADGNVAVADTTPLGALEVDGYASRYQVFDPAGSQLDEIDTPGFDGRIVGFALDEGGNAYFASTGTTGAVRKYSPAGACLNCGDPLNPSGNISALEADEASHLFLSDNDGAGRMIAEYDESGNPRRVFGYGLLNSAVSGLARGSSGMFASEGAGGASRIHLVSFPAAGPVVPPILGNTVAAPVRSTRATLRGHVNPEGLETSYHFEYVDEDTYQDDVADLGPGHGFDHAKRLPANPADDPVLPADFQAHAVSGEATGLAPETGYRFRIVAENADGSDGFEGKPFETLEPVELLGTWATRVETGSGRLNASVNPLGSPATGYFEYVDDATYQADVEALGPGHGFDNAIEAPPASSPLEFGESEEPQTRSADLISLQPGTTYHYRFTVTNPFTTRLSPERTFSTDVPVEEAEDSCPNVSVRLGQSRYLPDCRAYELVSPVDKEGGAIIALPNLSSFPTEFDRSSPDGNRATYSTYRAIGDSEGSPWITQYLAERDVGGWTSRSITPPSGPSFYGGLFDNWYMGFSEDLCRGWLRHDTEPTLTTAAPAGYPNLYRADLCSQPRSYLALSEAVPDVTPFNFQPELQGVSADGEVAVFRVKAKLHANALSGGFQTYASRGGKLRTICVLPTGFAAGSCSAGTATSDFQTAREHSVSNAVSQDGTKIYWTSGVLAGPIYLRENPFGSGPECSKATAPCTVPVSAAGEALSGSSASTFYSAAEDGSSAYYSTGGDLYRFGRAGETTSLIAEKTVAWIGASADGSKAYFVSEAAGAGEETEGAVAGKPNLYLYSDGVGITFVATLSAKDLSFRPSQPFIPVSRVRPAASVSEDGVHLAFTSFGSPTGYDNLDANGRQPAQEVFVFDATNPDPEARLHCVSCRPGGASPEAEKVDGPNNTVAWMAATLPSWQNQLYQPRYLSQGGSRLFFESTEPLLGRDTNGRKDVYQWQRAGHQQQCDEMRAGVYRGIADGCLSLISSGSGIADSKFLDADPAGESVFFATLDSLVPQDPGARDVYVARVGGGFPPPPSAPPACQGEACQGPVPALPPPPATPASNSHVGSETVPRAAKRHKKRQGRKHRRKKRHGKKHQISRRAALSSDAGRVER